MPEELVRSGIGPRQLPDQARKLVPMPERGNEFRRPINSRNGKFLQTCSSVPTNTPGKWRNFLARYLKFDTLLRAVGHFDSRDVAQCLDNFVLC